MSTPIVINSAGANINLASDFQEFASNDGSGGTAAGATYNTGMKYGPEGSNFVAVDSTTSSYSTWYKVSFKRAIQSTDLLVLERYFRGGWVTEPEYTDKAQLSTRYGYCIYPIQGDPYSIYVAFGNGGATTFAQSAFASPGQNPWSALTSYKWRVRKISNGNMAEVPDTTIQPLTSVPASAYAGTYTIVGRGERKIYIPKAYLKTAGTAGTLTITAGSSRNLVIPLSASGDTITSDDLLVPIYINGAGDVITSSFEISGSNTNGSYIKHADGTMECWNNKSVVININNTYAYLSTLYYNTYNITLPVYFIDSTWAFETSWRSEGTLMWTSNAVDAQTVNSITIYIIHPGIAINTSIAYSWHAIGRWRA